jgi:hypothetical protein
MRRDLTLETGLNGGDNPENHAGTPLAFGVYPSIEAAHKERR